MSRRPLVIVLHGPSGVGKDSVIDLLRAETGIRRATSSTSRAPREGEEDGNHYHFLTRKAFEEKARADKFAEWAKVYGDYKGLERAELDRPLAAGDDVIIRTDVQGAKTWREKLDGAISIFLVASDRPRPIVRVSHGEALPETLVEEIKTVLERRLRSRATEDHVSLKTRLEEVDKELEDLPNNDYIVFNADGHLEATVAELRALIEREGTNPERPAARLRT